MNLRYWLLLIAAQTIWASSYTAMKLALAELPFSLVIVLRYGAVAVFFLTYWCIRGFPVLDKRIVLGSFVIGFMNFYGSQSLQLHGLQHTQAIDVSILILFEPMLTVLMAYFFLKERISKNLWIVLLVSMFGFFMISDIRLSADGFAMSKMRLYGNALFLGALIFESICSVFGKFFTQKNHAFDAMGLLMSFGGVVGFVMHAPEVMTYSYAQVSGKVWWSMAFLALGCSVFAYTAWYYAISKVRVQFVALSLFLQPIVGSIVGYMVLGEQLSARTLIGATIISIGLVWWQTKRSQFLET